MKCTNCNQKIESCFECNNPFDKGGEVLCAEEGHYCDASCYVADLGVCLCGVK